MTLSMKVKLSHWVNRQGGKWKVENGKMGQGVWTPKKLKLRRGRVALDKFQRQIKYLLGSSSGSNILS